MRRRLPTVVLWGGRYGYDVQFGSDLDRSLTARRAQLARLFRVNRQVNRAFDELGAAAARAAEQLVCLAR